MITRDITGQKFNRLTAIRLHHIKKTKGGSVHYWLFRCDCGNEKVIVKISVTSNITKSCGCLNKEQLKSIRHLSYKHELCNHRLYYIWTTMKARCNNPKSQKYKNYGLRGIRVCDEWLNDFKVFYDWAMQNGYKDNLSIDRIDVNGNYEPNNCRWATNIQQSNNRTNNYLITYNNETHTIAEWARIINVKYQTLYMRLRRGWSFSQCM